jgi:IS5 family transposase
VEQLYADVANLSDEELEDELERMKSLDASG